MNYEFRIKNGVASIARWGVLLACLVSVLSVTTIPVAIAAEPTTNLNSSAFKIVACDGPENLNHINPATGKIEQGYIADPSFVPCNFKGVMIQIQHLINIMMVVGVFASIAAFSWGGFLYITGKEGNIKKAHEIFPKVFIGFIIMLSAWFIVYQILSWLTDNDAFKSLLGSP